MMRRAIICLAAVLISIPFAVAVAAGAETLPPDTPAEIQASFRAMVRAGVPDGDAVLMTQNMLQNRFTVRQIVRAHREVQVAAEGNLDPGQVIQKAREGLAKGAPPENIIKAMETVRERHRFSRQLAGPLAKDTAVRLRLRRMIADALAAGVDREDCERLAARIRTRQREMNRTRAAGLAEESMAALRDMARLGASSNASSACVQAALEAGFGDEDIKALRLRFRAEVRSGGADELALKYALKIAEGAGPGQLGDGSGSGGGDSGNNGGGQSSGSGGGKGHGGRP